MKKLGIALAVIGGGIVLIHVIYTYLFSGKDLAYVRMVEGGQLTDKIASGEIEEDGDIRVRLKPLALDPGMNPIRAIIYMEYSYAGALTRPSLDYDMEIVAPDGSRAHHAHGHSSESDNGHGVSSIGSISTTQVGGSFSVQDGGDYAVSFRFHPYKSSVKQTGVEFRSNAGSLNWQIIGAGVIIGLLGGAIIAFVD
ncbi:MAG TPA: hypothetical protein PL033_04745 [Candidatus Brocadiia bacterium]|nr:hypothetical protein [Candidatus Brocadiia bacterium]